MQIQWLKGEIRNPGNDHRMTAYCFFYVCIFYSLQSWEIAGQDIWTGSYSCTSNKEAYRIDSQKPLSFSRVSISLNSSFTWGSPATSKEISIMAKQATKTDWIMCLSPFTLLTRQADFFPECFRVPQKAFTFLVLTLLPLVIKECFPCLFIIHSILLPPFAKHNTTFYYCIHFSAHG